MVVVTIKNWFLPKYNPTIISSVQKQCLVYFNGCTLCYCRLGLLGVGEAVLHQRASRVSLSSSSSLASLVTHSIPSLPPPLPPVGDTRGRPTSKHHGYKILRVFEINDSYVSTGLAIPD